MHGTQVLQRAHAPVSQAGCTRRPRPAAAKLLSAFGALMLLACSSKDDALTANGNFGDASTPIVAIAGGAGAGPGLPGGTSSGGNTTPVPGSVITPIAIDQCAANNPAVVSAQQIATLKAGGSAGSMRVLYPYDGTVFPRGLTAPTIMWENAGSDAVYVHLKASNFEYHGCLRPSAAGQLQLPQDVWDSAGRQTGGRSDPLNVELTALNGQAANGPIKLRWVIAQATLKGSIYYNSYNTQLGGAIGGALGNIGSNGAILRLRPGRGAEVFARTGSCTGCHSMAANGERMIASEVGIGTAGNAIDAIGSLLGGLGGAAGGGIGGVIGSGSIYALTPDTAANPTPARNATSTSFAGVTPDGKLYLTSASAPEAGPLVQGGVGFGVGDSVLYETDSGNVVSDSGIPSTAMMPTFSADGSLLTFSDRTQQGHAIVVMDFDAKTRKASNARTLVTDNGHYLGWPFVLPDNRAVVFSITEEPNFSGSGVGISPIIASGPASDLALVDLTSKKVMLLAKAVGFANEADYNAGKTYLPFGAEEVHQHYYPTVSPVSAGGYFWLFFDSVRHYGNAGLHRQLWGVAIAIASVGELSVGQYESDPSAPAFYLAGQELPVANHRAFTALDPCRKDGASCETGIDCCNGFCTNGMCGRAVMRCSETNEACTKKSDCCKTSDQCIGGYCGVVLD